MPLVDRFFTSDSDIKIVSVPDDEPQITLYDDRGYIAAHMPGKHDQATHGHGGARARLGEQMQLEVVASEHLGGGASGSEVIRETRSDGSMTLRKKFSEDDMSLEAVDREVLGAEVAEALGLDNVAVVQVGDDEIVTTFHEGSTGLRLMESDGASYTQAFESEDGRRIGMLDYVTTNEDRHDGNWVRTNDGRIAPIDHTGMRFENTQLLDGTSPFEIVAGLNPGFGVPSVFTRAELDDIGDRLDGLKSKFAERGHSDWHSAMMRKFDVIKAADE